MNEVKRFFEEFEYPSNEQWKEAAIKALKGAPFDKKMFTKTYEDIILNPIYTQDDVEKNQFAKSLPGFAPYIRGNEVEGFEKDAWLIAQNIPYPIPQKFNEALISDIQRGQTAINMKATVLWDGESTTDLDKVLIHTLMDFATALNKVDVEKTPMLFRGGELTYIYSAYYYEYLKKIGVDTQKVSAYFGIDPIGSLTRSGKLYSTVDNYLEQAAELINYSKENAAKSKALLVDTSVYHNAGGSAVHELGLGLATGVYYLRAMLDKGIDINTAAKSIWFIFSNGTNLFIEISKLRAARLLWAKIISEFGGDAEAQKMFIHTQTSWRDNSKYDPYVNMLRNASSGFAAAIGNTDSMEILHFDNKHRLPDEFSRRTARNTQHILSEETHLRDTIDPAGGSWYIETLTVQLAEKSWNYFRSIESDGGILEALKSEKIQGEIHGITIMRDKNISTRKDVILGTNQYPNLNETELNSTKNISQVDIDAYIGRLAKEYHTVTRLITENLDKFDEIMEHAGKNIFIRDIAEKLYANSKIDEIVALKPHRAAELFEQLRDNSQKYTDKYGKEPMISLLCYGLLKEYKPRADFANDFFQTGGFATEMLTGYTSKEEIIKAAEKIDNKVVVLCSIDPYYEEFVEETAKSLKAKNKDITIVLAGYPKDKIEVYNKAGVDEYIHIKANLYNIVSTVQKKYSV